MRALVLILILVVLVGLGAVLTGYVNITHLRGEPPKVTATRSSITIKGGQPPAFDVEAGSVKVGSKEAKVAIPTLEIRKPTNNQQAATTNNMM
ncbi:MAG TPA: hypothetical protein VGU01_00985 [Sphingomicrobium sp.]|nr:hypothetical protein [Sphingomicrobium sp.]